MYRLCHDFHNRVADIKSINHSYITLVPKKTTLKLCMISDQSLFLTHPQK
jgi:hypothetical protein